jgi:hypothetical protein
MGPREAALQALKRFRVRCSLLLHFDIDVLQKRTCQQRTSSHGRAQPPECKELLGVLMKDPRIRSSRSVNMPLCATSIDYVNKLVDLLTEG